MTVLGASVSIAGLLLVFSGFLFTQAATLPATMSDEIIDRFRRGGKLAMVPFLLSLLVAGASFWWLLHQTVWLYDQISYGFMLLLVVTAAYGALTILRYL